MNQTQKRRQQLLSGAEKQRVAQNPIVSQNPKSSKILDLIQIDTELIENYKGTTSGINENTANQFLTQSKGQFSQNQANQQLRDRRQTYSHPQNEEIKNSKTKKQNMDQPHLSNQQLPQLKSRRSLYNFERPEESDMLRNTQPELKQNRNESNPQKNIAPIIPIQNMSRLHLQSSAIKAMEAKRLSKQLMQQKKEKEQARSYLKGLSQKSDQRSQASIRSQRSNSIESGAARSGSLSCTSDATSNSNLGNYLVAKVKHLHLVDKDNVLLENDGFQKINIRQRDTIMQDTNQQNNNMNDQDKNSIQSKDEIVLVCKLQEDIKMAHQQIIQEQEYKTEDVSQILKLAKKYLSHINDHAKYQVKVISFQILSKKEHKTLYEDALALLAKLMTQTSQIESNSGLPADIELQINLIGEVLEYFSQNIEKIASEIKMTRVTHKRIMEVLKKKALFRSTDKISFYTYVLIYLIQSTIIGTQQDFNASQISTHTALLCNGLATLLLEKIKQDVNDSYSVNEGQILFHIIVQDLASHCLTGAIELPISILLSKAIILQLIQCLYQNSQQQQQRNAVSDDDNTQNTTAQKLDLSTRSFIVELLSLFMSSIQKITKEAQDNSNLGCYCGVRITTDKSSKVNEQVVPCDTCSKLCHTKCVSLSNHKQTNRHEHDNIKSSKFICLECELIQNSKNRKTIEQEEEEKIMKQQTRKSVMLGRTLVASKSTNYAQLDHMYEQLKMFYYQYQSSYYDFSSSMAFILLRQYDNNTLSQQNCINNKKKSTSNTDSIDDFAQPSSLKELQIKDEFEALLASTDREEKTWITRGHKFDVTYARRVMRFINVETELIDLFQALKNMMLCVSYSKQATIRAKAIKAIKKIIKIDPDNLLDKQVEKIIHLRVQDVSAGTRENALDLISLFIQSNTNNSNNESQVDYQAINNNEWKYIKAYLPMIMERSNDTSIVVRKKVVNILSSILEKEDLKGSNYEGQQNASSSSKIRQEVIRVLIMKWEDASGSIRASLVNCLHKVFTQYIANSKLDIAKSNSQKHKADSEQGSGTDKIYELLKSIVMTIEEPLQQHFEIILKEVMNPQLIVQDQNLEKLNVKSARKSRGANIILHEDKYGGEEIVKTCIIDLIALDYKSEQFIKLLQLVKILGKVNGKYICKQIKMISSLLVNYLIQHNHFKLINNLQLESVTDMKAQGEICNILKLIVEWSLQDSTNQNENNSYLTQRQITELTTSAELIVLRSPLLILYPALELLNNISQLTKDYSLLKDLYLKCLFFVQTEVKRLNSQSCKNSNFPNEKLLALCRSILITSYLTYLCNFQQLGKMLDIDIKSELFTTFYGLISSTNLDQQVFDIALEGLSYVWLEYPDLMLQDSNCQNIFKITLTKFSSSQKNNNSRMQLKPQTKARVIQTFTKFLVLYDNKVKQCAIQNKDQLQQIQTDMAPILITLERELHQFTELLNVPDASIRLAVGELISKMFDQGILQFIEAAKLFVMMLNDCNPRARQLAVTALQHLAQKKIEIVTSALQPREFLYNSYHYQNQIYSQLQFNQSKNYQATNATGLIKVIDNNNEILTSQECILDQILSIIDSINNKAMLSFINGFIELGLTDIGTSTDDIQNENSNVLDSCCSFSQFYGDILFGLLKLGKHQDKYLKDIELQLQRHELVIYTDLKKGIQSYKKLATKDLYNRGYRLYIFKLAFKLCHKLIQIQKKDTQPDGTVNDQNEFLNNKFGEMQISSLKGASQQVELRTISPQQKAERMQRIVIEYMERLPELALPVKIQNYSTTLLQHLNDLKDSLRMLVREKEDLYKQKIESELYGQKRRRKTQGSVAPFNGAKKSLAVNKQKRRISAMSSYESRKTLTQTNVKRRRVSAVVEEVEEESIDESQDETSEY